jgi:Na+-driven multidrug efflux pump
MLQILVDTTSWVVLVRVIALFGSTAVAGYTIGIRTVLFAILPSWGMSNAAATMVGQALGAGKPERAEAAVWTACRYNLYFLGVIGAVFVALAPQIVAIYTLDPVIAAEAIACLRIISIGFVLFAYGMVLTQAFNGAGDAWTPTWINVACFWVWQMPLAYYLALGVGMGPSGVYWAVMIAFSTLAVVSAVIFRRGKWKTQQV